jgi:hypothetical protein
VDKDGIVRGRYARIEELLGKNWIFGNF